MQPDVSIYTFAGYFIAALGAGLGWHLGRRVIEKLT